MQKRGPGKAPRQSCLQGRAKVPFDPLPPCFQRLLLCWVWRCGGRGFAAEAILTTRVTEEAQPPPQGLWEGAMVLLCLPWAVRELLGREQGAQWLDQDLKELKEAMSHWPAPSTLPTTPSGLPPPRPRPPGFSDTLP